MKNKMGAGVSTGNSNDDLVDALLNAEYIKTPLVEKVFRAVDRGFYFTDSSPDDVNVNPYRDAAWKAGNLHISAPCIYSAVIESLQLHQGMSFLNLGSGTGYLNTMAGLMIGNAGINHGIELHSDVVAYAFRKLDEFKRHSGAVDEFDFCEPKFLVGNCLTLIVGRQYDRVYCGAGCPEAYLGFIKEFVKVGGRLVVPVNEELLEMRRETEKEWAANCLLPVAFAGLVQPTRDCHNSLDLMNLNPGSLQQMCRVQIRSILRKAIIDERHTDLDQHLKIGERRNKKLKARRHDKQPKSLQKHKNNANLHKRVSCNHQFFLHVANRTKIFTCPRSQNESDNINDLVYGDLSSANSSSDDDSSSDELSFDEKMLNLQSIFLDFMSHETDNNHLNQANSFIDPNSSSNEQSCVNPSSLEPIDNCDIENIVMKNTATTSNSGSNSSSGVDTSEIANKKSKRMSKFKERNGSKLRKLDLTEDEKDCSEEEGERLENMNAMKMYISPFTVFMANRIRELPLPMVLKKYLHYYKDI